jgi:hypothetical protein
MAKPKSKGFRIEPEHFADSYKKGLQRLRAHRQIGEMPKGTKAGLREHSEATGIPVDTLWYWVNKGVKPKAVKGMERINEVVPLDPYHPNFNNFLLLNYATLFSGSLGKTQGNRLMLRGHPDVLRNFKGEIFDKIGIDAEIKRPSGRYKSPVLIPEKASTLGRAVSLFHPHSERGNVRLPPELAKWASAIKRADAGHYVGDERDLIIARRALEDFSAAALSRARRTPEGVQVFLDLPKQEKRENAEGISKDSIHVLTASMPRLSLEQDNIRVYDNGSRYPKSRWTPRIVLHEEDVQRLKEEYPNMLRFNPKLK